MQMVRCYNDEAKQAGVVKLADTQGLGPCTRKGVQVQLLSPAPRVIRSYSLHVSDFGRIRYGFRISASLPQKCCAFSGTP